MLYVQLGGLLKGLGCYNYFKLSGSLYNGPRVFERMLESMLWLNDIGSK